MLKGGGGGVEWVRDGIDELQTIENMRQFV